MIKITSVYVVTTGGPAFKNQSGSQLGNIICSVVLKNSKTNSVVTALVENVQNVILNISKQFKKESIPGPINTKIRTSKGQTLNTVNDFNNVN